MTTRAASVSLLLLAACTDSSSTSELVVRDAALGAGAPVVLGVNQGAVYWSVGVGGTRQAAGSSLATLPAEGRLLGAAAGPLVMAGDHLLLATADSIVRTDLAAQPRTIVKASAQALGQAPGVSGMVAWSTGPMITWGELEAPVLATLPKVERCDHMLITSASLYVAGDSTSERRLMRIDRASHLVLPRTDSKSYGAAFPGGAQDGATYRGRIVGAAADAAYWLVEELPAGKTASTRAILVSVPDVGMPSVVLEHIGAVSTFFVTDDAFYWQEDDALLTAPRAGGSATIAAQLPGRAGAVADGFVYYATGTTIERLALD
ncbi:hypothetical protein BH11MYX3_BH11MYX3_01900 [soil metagenome]